MWLRLMAINIEITGCSGQSDLCTFHVCFQDDLTSKARSTKKREKMKTKTEK